MVRIELAGQVKSWMWAAFNGAINQNTAETFGETFYLTEDGYNTTKTFAVHPYISPPYELYVIRPVVNHKPTSPPIAVILNGTQVLSSVVFNRMMHRSSPGRLISQR